MEFHIQQVLYRDLRTIKTRYIDASTSHHRRNSCRPDQAVSMEAPRFFPVEVHHQGCSSTNAECGITPVSSLNYCHNQYSLKSKRLTFQRTDRQCTCDNVDTSGINDVRKRTVNCWIKKLQNVLLLITYLSLLTLPNTHALPARMCNRPSDKTPGFWVNPCGSDYEPSGEPPSEMNSTSVKITINSATSALISARYLKEKYRNQTIDNLGTDPEALYPGLKYDWLPNVPKVQNDEEFKQHLSSLKWQDSLLDIFHHLQTISVPLEQLIIDFNQDGSEVLRANFSQMEGLVLNVLCELHDSIADNNLKVRQNVDRDIMPSKLRQVCNNKTDRIVRDWIVLRELVNILEYTVVVCKYLTKGTFEFDI